MQLAVLRIMPGRLVVSLKRGLRGLQDGGSIAFAAPDGADVAMQQGMLLFTVS
jgi:hypothetical protein